MGCSSSVPQIRHQTDEVKDTPQDAVEEACIDNGECITVLVVGRGGVGKSSFGHRFVNGTFNAEDESFTLGVRDINIHGTQTVTIRLVSASHATPRDVARAEGVFYLIRGDVDNPFEYATCDCDVLTQGSFSFDHGGRPIAPSLLRVDKGTQLSPRPATDAGAGKMRDRVVTMSSADSVDAAPSITTVGDQNNDTDAVQCPSSLAGLGVGLSVQTSGLLTTTPSFRRPRAAIHGDDATTHRPIVHLVVTHCDIVDAMAATNSEQLRRLKAMAHSWSGSNRCRISCLSSKTGIGVNMAVRLMARDVHNARVLRSTTR